MEIKRYDMFLDGFERHWDYEESPTGDWVKAIDHDDLVNKLRAENEALKASFWVKTDHNAAVTQLRAENEALKASIPKLKADAVREAAVLTADNDVGCYVIRDKVARDTLIVYADKLEGQAAKGN